ncbi:GNAT family N-acetyltransferase [Cellulomonas sp. H30R-01]|uniref:GNAT family N-acetyltransferase n=1 Tax=Cellulomonas sp. H30R-01 TaxID=2704467 RepID=UPI00138B2355|nr:GNAT family protein [Cellulomonas sp. H30R-01]QHT54707.1 GNAT family N-acetyltransferase [Cellulomonas sp. H30R-01]
MAVGWPAVLQDGPVRLRPLRRRDQDTWMELRSRNAGWLEPWDATSPEPPPAVRPTFGAFVRTLSAQARSGVTLPFAVDFEDRLVGQLTVASIAYGSLRSASIGYWVSEHVAGRGITPTAVALATDHCFGVLGLHRVEINIRPENRPSLRVVEKLGFRDEGLRERYLHIQGRWCDHRTFALTAEEVPEGLLARWRATRGASAG